MKILFRKAFIRLLPFMPSLAFKLFACTMCMLLFLQPPLSILKGKANFGYLLVKSYNMIKMIHFVLHCRSAAKSGTERGTHGCQSVVFLSNTPVCHTQCYGILCSTQYLKLNAVCLLFLI